MDLPNFLATHRPLKRKLAADDDDAPPATQHSQPADHQLPHPHAHAHGGPPAECSGGSSSSAGGGSAGGIGISISIAPAAPRQPWIPDADDAATAAARWASPAPSPISSPTATAAPQVSSPLSPARAPKRLRVDTQDAVVRPHALSRGGAKHYPRRSAVVPKTTTTRLSAPPTSLGVRQGSDLEDIGVVSRAAPGPASGSLLRAPRTPGGEGAIGSGSMDMHGDGSSSSSVSSAHTNGPANTYVVPPPPLKLSRSPHIPPMAPLITRATLRELELDVILRNPVIRHDLLFDPGLQFRPRRTRAVCERYWDAVWREVRLGCTCVTLDVQGGVHPTRCICDNANRHPLSPTAPSTPTSPTTSSLPPTPTVLSTPSTPTPPCPHHQLQLLYTIRTPPRLPLLLAELRAVLLLVVQPLSTSTTAVYTNPAAVRAQAEEHARHAGELKEVLDGVLEAGASGRGRGQGMSGVDLGPVFERIGATLKRHCAPMRDRRVDAMVGAAKQGGARAFGAVRMCLELLELMKLDIANHQLAQLRPWLLRNTSAFEAKAFRIRFGAGPHALRHTRVWLAAADRALCGNRRGVSASTPAASSEEDAITETPAPGPLAHTPYIRLTRNQRIYLCVLKGIVDLVFSASPGEIPAFTLSEIRKDEEEGKEGKNVQAEGTVGGEGAEDAQQKTEGAPSSPSSLILPETLYLDKTRLCLLSGEASDVTSVYMLSLLFRQLVGTDANVNASAESDITDSIARLKTELHVLAPVGLGACFVAPEEQKEREDVDKQKPEEAKKGDVEMVHAVAQTSLQQQQRAKKEKDVEDERVRRRRVREDVTLQVASRAEETRQRRRRSHTDTSSIASDSTTQHSTPTAPTPALLSLAQCWATTHMQPTAPLAHTLHSRVRDAVLDEVIALLYPSTNANGSGSTGVDISSAGGLHVFTGRVMYPHPLPTLPCGHAHSAAVSTVVPAPALVDAERKSSLGLDALAGEIRRLAGRVARLAEVHLGTHLPMYESEGFLGAEDGAVVA